MRVLTLSLTLTACLTVSEILSAQDDAPGCKDSPLLTRLSGCYIRHCGRSDFDAAAVTVAISGKNRTKQLEGKIEKVSYECNGKSALQVRRNAERALAGAGFSIDFTGYDVPLHYVTAHKGGLWIAVSASEMGSNCTYEFTAVETGDMTQEMKSDAKAWADQINKSGRVAVYGIEFDTGKATLRPESEKVLWEVVKLLSDQPTLSLTVEGHTDSTGTKQWNVALSQQRAAAVVAWLVKRGYAPERLTPVGLGDGKPVADNSTEEGRARNRRVELVKK